MYRLETGGSRHIVFSPGGRLVAAAGSRGVTLWDVDRGERLQTLPGSGPIGFSSDGRVLLTR